MRSLIRRKKGQIIKGKKIEEAILLDEEKDKIVKKHYKKYLMNNRKYPIQMWVLWAISIQIRTRMKIWFKETN